MKSVIIHGPRDVRVETREDPRIELSTDAIIRVVASCVCGTDLWDYRGANERHAPLAMGHEYVGVVVEVGADVRRVTPGQFVVGSFIASDGECDACQRGFTSACIQATYMGSLGAQSEFLRVPLADGTLLATPEMPDRRQTLSLLAASDVLGTGWYGAAAAEVGPGKTVVVVGDGAVGLCAVLAAHHLGAERIIAMSRTPARQARARSFGATDIVEARGAEGVAAVRELTQGLGAHSVVEAVGTQESITQAIRSTRAGGHVGHVGLAHGVSLDGAELFAAQVHLHGGPAPVRRFLPDLVEKILAGRLSAADVFDLEIDLEDAAEGYRAMDERRAVKALLRMP